MNSKSVYLVALVVAISLSVCYAGEDYYATLGVSRDASDGDIKKAYRKLSMKYHPDKNRGDASAESKYAAVNRAYEVLSDSGKRQVYDRHGEEGLQQHEQGGGGGGGAPFDIFEQVFGFGEDEDDDDGFNPFGDMFGGGFKIRFGNQGGQRSGPRKAKKLKIIFDTSLADLYNGKKYEINQRRSDGEEQRLSLVIERGMKHGDKIKFEGKGDPKGERLPGDIIYHINELPHESFQRDGDNLHVSMKLSLLESLVGWRTEFTHLDGRTVAYEETGVTPPDSTVVLSGEGMPKRDYPSEKGDLIIHCKVEFPERITDAQRTAFAQAFSGF